MGKLNLDLAKHLISYSITVLSCMHASVVSDVIERRRLRLTSL